jgi:hypothetical protein
MHRHKLGTVLAAVLLAAALPAAAHAGGGVRVGIGIGFPLYPAYPHYYYRPYPYYYYPPPAVVVTPPPPPVTVVQPAAPAPVVAVSPTTQAPPPPPSEGTALATLPPPLPQPTDAELQGYLTRLRDGDERVRADAALQLGRLQAQRAVEPLSATLASDRSPAVRDAAARALGLIGTPATLPALQRAAQADDDREVRASARFAAETVRDRLRR